MDPCDAPATIEIRLLGGFSVARDGTALSAPWPGRRSAELVQLLSLAPEHRLVRDQVIEALWPHLPADAGAANLRKAAHHARRALGDPASVVLRGGEVLLFPHATVGTDVADFRAAADAALAAGGADAARAAASAYAGELLPSALYEDWAAEPRAALRDRYLELLRAASLWEDLLRAEPTDEVACRALMAQAMADGNRHAAIGWYGRVRAALQRELGVLPSEETVALYDACTASLVPPPTPFVGRARELATLTAPLGATAQTATLVAVSGPAGMGKTTLCQEVVTAASTAGWRALMVTADRAPAPYGVLAGIVERAVAADRTLLDRLGERTRSLLQELTPVMAPAPPLEAPLTRHQVIGAVRQVLLAAAGDAGTVVLVDDAHCADAASMETLVHLVDGSAAPLLVVLALRAEAASDLLRRELGRLVRAGWGRQLDLGPLDRDEARLLAATAGLADAAGALPAVLDRAEGNPFFVLELARRAVEGGGQQLDAGLRDAITARFVDLDDATTAVLRRLAIVGGDLDLVRVVALTGATEEAVFELLDTALLAGVLVVSDGAYRFRHDLVRQALAAQLAPHHRIAVHRDAARRLAELGARPGVVARHWLDGGRPERAIPWLLDAAHEAMRLDGFDDALGFLDELLVHEPEHVEALLMRASALDALGDGRALAAYSAAARAAGSDAEHEIRPRQALAQIKQGDPAGALDTLGDAAPVSLEGRLAQALTLSGAAALGFGDPAVGSAKAADARRLAFESGDPAAVVVASWAQSAAAHARGDLRGSLRADLYDTYALPKLAVSVFDGQLCITQRLLYGARPYDDVIEFLDAFATEAARLRASRGYAFAITLKGEAELLAGRLDAAAADLEEGFQLHLELGAPTGQAFALQRRAELALLHDDRAGAAALLDQALTVARESDVGFHLLDRIYGTRIVLAGDDPTAARAAVEDAEASVRGPNESCPGCRITLAVPAAIGASHARDLDRVATYERSSEWLAEVVMRLPAWYAALDEVRAHARLAEGDAAAAVARITAAAERYRAAGHPLDHDRCRALQARWS